MTNEKISPISFLLSESNYSLWLYTGVLCILHKKYVLHCTLFASLKWTSLSNFKSWFISSRPTAVLQVTLFLFVGRLGILLMIVHHLFLKTFLIKRGKIVGHNCWKKFSTVVIALTVEATKTFCFVKYVFFNRKMNISSHKMNWIRLEKLISFFFFFDRVYLIMAGGWNYMKNMIQRMVD